MGSRFAFGQDRTWDCAVGVQIGLVEEAITVFDRVCHHANPLGLFFEDIDPSTGRLLGNFPQAYAHVGLIHAAITIGEHLEAQEVRVRAWS
jgi:GH15 family glucan-1,4-alpha-glucosidase